MARDYNAAITALNTLQSNFAIVDAIRKSGKSMNQQAIPEMIEWCSRIGYKPSDFDRLNLIHIAGTKGKGSTSAFISSIFQQYVNSTRDVASNTSYKGPRKVGLYTSPHLRSVRERIRIDDEPISEELFARYFFEVWDRLENAAKERGAAPGTNGPADKPVYFRYLTLMMFHAYLSEGVDTAVVECGIGGEYDSTNVIQRPTVSAVTNLGVDHVAVLGSTVEEIAWHKAGIFKSGSQCKQVFTVEHQPGDAAQVLTKRAAERGLELVQVSRHPQIQDGSIPLGLDADFQKSNASIAVAVAAAHLRTLGVPDLPTPGSSSPLPPLFRSGLQKVQWGGRCETRHEGNLTWYIDGGHTLESIKLAAEWFSARVPRDAPDMRRVLFFNQQTRDAEALARQLHTTLTASVDDALQPAGQPLFHDAVFSTNITFGAAGGQYKADLVSLNTSSQDVSALTVQRALASVWPTLDAHAAVSVQPTIQAAVEHVRALATASSAPCAVLVTGSLHLVGGVLEVLETIPRT